MAAPADGASLAARAAAGRPLLAYGDGRSYGDSCLNDAGLLLDMRGRNRILAFDPATGRLLAEAGALIADIASLTLPQGWLLPVTPGTEQVSLGGAIASDVHGKNHHGRGSFGRHVRAMTLIRSDGSTRTPSPTENPDLFSATIAGLGLTGLVATAEVQLMRVPSAFIAERVCRFRRLDAFLALSEAADRASEYSVAWIDSIAGGGAAERGLLITGDHAGAEESAGAEQPVRRRLRVPFNPPVPLVNRATLAAFNALYWRRPERTRRLVPVRQFFYPLDGIGDWNRLYGRRGLYQHQSVLPFPDAPGAVAEMLALTRRAGLASFLTVLKRFGDLASPGLLSFPRAGLTLTLDFPAGGRVPAVLDDLDRIVRAAKGAVCPYKDALMSSETFRASFPGWRRLLPFVDPAFSSNFWRRVTGDAA